GPIRQDIESCLGNPVHHEVAVEALGASRLATFFHRSVLIREGPPTLRTAIVVQTHIDQISAVMRSTICFTRLASESPRFFARWASSSHCPGEKSTSIRP